MSDPNSRGEMDVVYIVGKGSKWADNELRYSLRSLHRHVHGVRDVWIVGHKPTWCAAKHIAMDDPYADKEKNLIAKILRACRIDGLSSTVLIHSDDQYWLEDIRSCHIPLWRRVHPLTCRGDAYADRIAASNKLLASRGVTPGRYDCHAPMPVRRDICSAVLQDLSGKHAGKLLWKIVYGSSVSAPGEPYADLKAGPDLDTYEKIHSALAGRMCFSTGPTIEPAMAAYLQWRFPVASPWEYVDGGEIVASAAPHDRDTACGVITAASEEFVPCAFALVRSVCEQGYPITVFSHGLSVSSIAALEAFGADVKFAEMAYDRSIAEIRNDHAGRISAPVEAWWKPLMCQRSPYARTIWIDADAISLRGLDDMFGWLEHGPFLTRDWWVPLERIALLYGPLVRAMSVDLSPDWEYRSWVNTGVIGWRTGDRLIDVWAEFCRMITADPSLLALCKCRDQSGMAALLADNPDIAVVVEDWRWNYPAHGLMARDAKRRPKCPAGEDLLAWARREHPLAYVVHWLGKYKAWRTDQ